jgi:hypothetical protein
LIPKDFVIIATVLLLAFVFVCAFVAAFYINLVTETFAWRYLVSSAIVATVAFWLPNIIANFMLPPTYWFKDLSLNLRYAILDRILYICAFSAIVAFTLWQLVARRRNCRLPI